MNRSLRKAVVLVAVVSAATVATSVRPPVAQAAPVVIAGCAGDTAAVRVTVDDGLLAGGAIVPIHDNTAGVTYPAPTDKAMSSPVCGAQRLADGSLRREWLYCTDPVLNTCATAPLVRKGDSATGIARLTAVDRARLAWVLDTEIHNDTQTTRVRGQRLVWCVTEHRAAGAPAPNYYNDGVNDQPLACPAWGAVDPALKMTVSLALTGPSAPVAVAQPAQFVLTTDASPITLTSTGISTMALCPGTSGASLAGGVLTIVAPDKNVPVRLCATRTSAGTGSMRAVVAQRTGRTLEFWQRAVGAEFCQGMLSSETLSTTAAAADAQAVFAADGPTPTTTIAAVTTTAAVTPTTTPTIPPTTVAIDGNVSSTAPVVLDTAAVTLPRTGARTGDDNAYWALVLLLAGVMLVALGRRPSRR